MACCVGFLLCAWTVFGRGILNTKHDLSVSGPGPVKASSETEVCLFCHTPHNGSGETPLWNHAVSKATYTPYESSTMKAAAGQPTGASKLCLSCHDGTVALGMLANRKEPLQMGGGVTTMPTGRSHVGTDLSDDHPISFVYDASLASKRGGLRVPDQLTGKVRLDNNKQVQCTSCHDPHNDEFGRFLVNANTFDGICAECHQPKDWETSIHRVTKAKLTAAALTAAVPGSNKPVISDNACENCHAPHTAGTKQRLLKFARAEQNCLSCHNGSLTAKNIEGELNKFSAHPVLMSNGLHDEAENPTNPSRHATCVDCHNPHAVRKQAAKAPNASGALTGVKGLSTSGALVESVTREYELCFRCHADSTRRGASPVPRQFAETNKRLQFAPENASFHPVARPGRNPRVPSLIMPFTASSMIYCTDCHNNDQGPGAGGTGPNGPHGSAYPSLLERRLETADFHMETAEAYDLCYKCHSRPIVLSDQSWKEHERHVVKEKTACTTCHDSHGVLSANHLINFNRNYVQPNSKGLLQYTSQGSFRGNCSLTCHGKDHDRTGY